MNGVHLRFLDVASILVAFIVEQTCDFLDAIIRTRLRRIVSSTSKQDFLITTEGQQRENRAKLNYEVKSPTNRLIDIKKISSSDPNHFENNQILIKCILTIERSK